MVLRCEMANCTSSVGKTSFGALVTTRTLKESKGRHTVTCFHLYLHVYGIHHMIDHDIMSLACFRRLAPACRATPERCITAITSGAGWGIFFLAQQATFHNMPVAFANANDWGSYVQQVREQQSLAYYWSPDSAFAELNPLPVEFPPFDSTEFDRQVYRTMNSRVEPLNRI